MTTLNEALDSMMARYNPAKAKGVNAVIQLNATGEGGGEYYITVSEGKAVLTPGEAANPNTSITVSAHDWIDIMDGKLDPTRAFMGGRLRIDGDLGLMMRFQSMFG